MSKGKLDCASLISGGGVADRAVVVVVEEVAIVVIVEVVLVDGDLVVALCRGVVGLAEMTWILRMDVVDVLVDRSVVVLIANVVAFSLIN